MRKICETEHFEIFEIHLGIMVKKKEGTESLKLISSSYGIELIAPKGKITRIGTEDEDLATVSKK